VHGNTRDCIVLEVFRILLQTEQREFVSHLAKALKGSQVRNDDHNSKKKIL
jgi:hypothetical protein